MILFKCSCSKTLYLCDQHAVSHCISVGKHNLEKVLSRIDDSPKTEIFNYIVSSIKDIHKKLSDLKLSTNKLLITIQSKAKELTFELRKSSENLQKELIILMKYSLARTNLIEEFKDKKIFEKWDFEMTDAYAQNILGEFYDSLACLASQKDDRYAIFSPLFFW